MDKLNGLVCGPGDRACGTTVMPSWMLMIWLVCMCVLGLGCVIALVNMCRREVPAETTHFG